MRHQTHICNTVSRQLNRHIVLIPNLNINMAENRFGIFYPITRIAFGVILVIALIFFVVGLIDCKGCFKEAGNIIWMIFAFLVLLIGVIAAWKEHFLFTVIFAVAEIILCGFGWGIGWYSGVGTVLAVIVAIIFAIMLYMINKRDMGMPDMDCRCNC